MMSAKKARARTIMDMLQAQSQPQVSQQRSLQSQFIPPPLPQVVPAGVRTRSQAQPLYQARQLEADIQQQSQTHSESLSLDQDVSQSTEGVGVDAGTCDSTSKKRGRGPAIGVDIWGTGKLLEVQFNDLMQPIGPNQKKLATQLGILARNGEKVPLYYESWANMPESILEYIWKEVQDNTNVPLEYKSNCLESVGLKWKNWKARVKANHYDKHETDAERLSYVPDRVQPDQWRVLVSYWNTEKMKDKCAKAKMSRAEQELPHRTGRTPFAQVREEMKSRGEEVTRLKVFLETRQSKRGRRVDEDTAIVISEFEEGLFQVPPEERTVTYQEELFNKRFGPDKHGRVRTYGAGVKHSAVFGTSTSSTSSSSTNRIHEEIRAELLSQFDVMFDARLATYRESIRAEILAEINAGVGPSTIGQVRSSSSVNETTHDNVNLDNWMRLYHTINI